MKFIVTNPGGLNGRRGPSKDAEVVRVAQQGDIITAVEVIPNRTAPGRRLVPGWAVTKSGVHYSLPYLKEVKEK